jgi:protein-L-isoaspartate(D-aspartate) O-methyltransferase
MNRERGVGMTSERTRERLIARLRAQGIRSETVLAQMRVVPRHVFVDEALASRAYEDTALPIGFGQTISQPYIVALMTEALVDELPIGGKIERVLEIGTGCGYQTAVVAPFARHVYSMERIFPLVQRAQQTLADLRIRNVSVRYADGWQGWRSQAPFHSIIVAAAAEIVPPELLAQLAEGGRLVIPVGSPGRQVLTRITRDGTDLRREELLPVSFVPLIEGTAR